MATVVVVVLLLGMLGYLVALVVVFLTAMWQEVIGPWLRRHSRRG